MNMTKLAKLAGVSVSTVSKVFSQSSEISEETRNKVIGIAKKDGCYEKYFKQRYPKKQIAVICPEILGIHYSKLATDIETEIRKYNATMVLSTSNFTSKTQSELIEYYSKYIQVDGIILIDAYGNLKNDIPVPIVAIGMKSEDQNVDFVNIDITNAMDSSLAFLQKNGHKNIGFIGENFATNEYNYFIDAMTRNNIAINSDFTAISDKRFYDAGYYGMDELLQRKTIPSVIYAAYSHIAVGLLQKLKEAKLTVPDDLSIICMDDISSVPYYPIQLSCIKMHLDDLASIAVELLIKRSKEKESSAKQSILIKREFSEGKTIKLLS